MSKNERKKQLTIPVFTYNINIINLRKIISKIFLIQKNYHKFLI